MFKTCRSQSPFFNSLLALVTLAALISTSTRSAAAGERVLDHRLHHLRIGDEREWTEFPERAESERLELTFTAVPNPGAQTLRLRHRDLKQAWKVTLNDREVGRLPSDENDMVTFWTVPPQALRAGENRLRITGSGKIADDVMIGELRLIDRPREEVLREATLDVSVTDAESGDPLPCRVTIVDASGSLMSLGAAADRQLAVRPGVVYTASGRAWLGLPAGRYVVFAGRGFEYGIDSARVEVRAGQVTEIRLKIRREVPTPGFVACDTHCHTLTHSGHGDASLDERMVTLAGEGIELPIATDHNIQIDYEHVAQECGVRQHFTPVIGNEVTTARLGHFNVFPIAARAPVIDPNGKDWEAVFRSIRATAGVQVVVLNHPRDLHGGFRPFGPKHQIGPAGENLDGWKLEADAMEIVNSGALQTDPLLLYRDWFGLLNRGLRIVPVGSSDSHDVSVHLVGQARTYIRCDDRNPAQIDPAAACRSVREGRVLVSMGLLADLEVEERFGPGDLATVNGDLDVRVRVLGPSWTRVRQVTLYMNGAAVREAEIPDRPDGTQPGGVKWECRWSVPRPRRDVHLAVVALGPGVTDPFWPIPKSYQPTSPEWHPYVLGSTGAVWVDADGSGKFTSALEYAAQAIEKSGVDAAPLLRHLADYDEAVAIQAASLLRARGVNLLSKEVTAALREAAPQVRRGFDQYISSWKESVAARSMP